MQVTWDGGQTKQTDWFKVEGADVAQDYGGVRFVPRSVAITVSMARGDDEDADGAPDGPSWDATVKGPMLRADGSVGARQHEARFWAHHTFAPPWLRVLAERCVARFDAKTAGEIWSSDTP